MENKIRNTLNEIYFGKTKDIVNGLRSVTPLPDQKQQAALRNDLAQAIKKRSEKSDTRSWSNFFKSAFLFLQFTNFSVNALTFMVLSSLHLR